MKAKILTLAILFGVCVSSYALNTINPNTTTVETVLTQDDGYKVVEAKDLDALIQQVIAIYEENFTIETIEYNEAESLTRLNLISKADESKVIVILDREGKEVKPEVEVEAEVLPEE